MLAQDQANPSPVNVLNLGSNNEGAYSFTQTLNDYDYLEGSRDLLQRVQRSEEPNYYNFRHRSPLFGLTG
jgi:hypothetical protein